MGKRTQLGELELIVMLALLRLGENAYGVPISREIEQQSGREVALGSVYATLERLQEKGLVSSNLGEPTAERGGRAKRYFRVTTKGLREARETRQALMKLWRGLRELQGGQV
ncbi:MAG TPA: PadR family transcriptional regulator [Candidatus Dormibacteraeota bacterium]|nr:PadR family transcriptional regulator [Candidatus Dormibacteraeota bacterium]